MTTTDSNGLIQYQTTDNVVPLQTTLNAISSSVSTALNSTVRTFKVANDTERDALATTRVPSATNPLIVWNGQSGKQYMEINTGSGWSRLLPLDNPLLASSSLPDSNNGRLFRVFSQSGITIAGGAYKTISFDYGETYSQIPLVIPTFEGSGSDPFKGTITSPSNSTTGCTLRVDNLGASSGTIQVRALVIRI